MRELKDFLAAVGAVYEPMGERVSLNNRRFAVAPEVAAQIHDRGYAKPYTGGTRPVYLIGAVFGAKGQGVVDWKMEKLK